MEWRATAATFEKVNRTGQLRPDTAHAWAPCALASYYKLRARLPTLIVTSDHVARVYPHCSGASPAWTHPITSCNQLFLGSHEESSITWGLLQSKHQHISVYEWGVCRGVSTCQDSTLAMPGAGTVGHRAERQHAKVLNYFSPTAILCLLWHH